MKFLRATWDASSTGAGLFWKAFWALALGYAISSAIQVFVARGEAAKHLGKARVRPVALAMLLGFASSSCSFAALSATRSLFVKGAHLITALAFMFASTNLAIEVAALAWIFLGWQFALALFVGAPVLVIVMAGIVRLTQPDRLVKEARRRAEQSQEDGGDASEGLPERVAERIRAAEAWRRIGRRYLMEWGMVWKELTLGFLVAGAVAALVPASFFNAIFPAGLAAWLLIPIHAVLGPMLALLTVIGSMGNGPLAAILWENGVLFAGIMAFLYSDFVVVPSLKINANYYGGRFAVYLGLTFAAAAVVTGIAVHALFAVIGLIPGDARKVTDLARFRIDYSFFLNLFALGVSLVLVWLARRRSAPTRSKDASERSSGP